MASDWSRHRLLPYVLLIALALGLTACGPEASRERGGGRGADPGNRDDTVELLGDTGRNQRIYYHTPDKAMGEE